MQSARKSLVFCVVMILMASAGSATPLKTPSKTAPDQDLATLQADLANIEEVLDNEEIAGALAADGLTEKEIHQRLAQFSPEELHALSSQLDQMHAAGAQVPQYIWILLAVLLGVLILAALI